MSDYTIYRVSDGEIVFSVKCDESLLNIYLSDGLAYLDGNFRSSEFFVNNGEAVEYSESVRVTKASRPLHAAEWSNVSMSWVDTRPLDDLKAAKWGQIKAQRDASEFGLFSWAGHTFDGDEAAQRRINLAVMGAQAAMAAGDAGWSVDWTLADNTSLALSASDMIGVANALGANIAQAHAAARAKRQQIEQAATKEELDAI